MNKVTDSEYIPQDDESEAARFAAIHGAGEVSYLDTDEIKQYALNDFGLSLSEKSGREDFR